jgi:PPM family protein phosphatase
MLNLEFACATDPGLCRDNNEDCVTFDAAARLGVLADGMGGYSAGEVASAMAATFIKSEMSRWLIEAGNKASWRDVARGLEICVDKTNTSIYQAAISNPQYSGMGTTLVVGVFTSDTLILGHIGDSRCYRLRQGHLKQLTRDHSLIQEQIDAGLLSAEQASLSNQKNLVTRALGVDPQVTLEITRHLLAPGDRYLFCSDGLSDMVDNETIAQTLGKHQSPEQKASALIDLANANGGIDNISVFLAEVKMETPSKNLLD